MKRLTDIFHLKSAGAEKICSVCGSKIKTNNVYRIENKIICKICYLKTKLPQNEAAMYEWFLRTHPLRMPGELPEFLNREGIDNRLIKNFNELLKEMSWMKIKLFIRNGIAIVIVVGLSIVFAIQGGIKGLLLWWLAVLVPGLVIFCTDVLILKYLHEDKEEFVKDMTEKRIENE